MQIFYHFSSKSFGIYPKISTFAEVRGCYTQLIRERSVILRLSRSCEFLLSRQATHHCPLHGREGAWRRNKVRRPASILTAEVSRCKGCKHKTVFTTIRLRAANGRSKRKCVCTQRAQPQVRIFNRTCIII